jgi:HK97 gp10 family phage protein
MIDFRIKGLEQIALALAQVPFKVERNIIRGGMRAGVKVIAADAKERVHSRSGRLAKSIRFGVSKIKGTRGDFIAYVRAGSSNKAKRDRAVWWAHMVEKGTASHVIIPKRAGAMLLGGKGARPVDKVLHPGASPRPFMRPALDTQARNAVLAMGAYMRQRLRTKHGLDTPDLVPFDADETP